MEVVGTVLTVVGFLISAVSLWIQVWQLRADRPVPAGPPAPSTSTTTPRRVPVIVADDRPTSSRRPPRTRESRLNLLSVLMIVFWLVLPALAGAGLPLTNYLDWPGQISAEARARAAGITGIAIVFIMITLPAHLRRRPRNRIIIGGTTVCGLVLLAAAIITWLWT